MPLAYQTHYVLWNTILSFGQLEKLMDRLAVLHNDRSTPKENKSWLTASSVYSTINSTDWIGVKWDHWWLIKKTYKSNKKAESPQLFRQRNQEIPFFLLHKVNFWWTDLQLRMKKKKSTVANSEYEKGCAEITAICRTAW